MLCGINLILLQRNNIFVSFSYQKQQELVLYPECHTFLITKGLLIHPECQTPEKTKFCVISILLSMLDPESTDPV